MNAAARPAMVTLDNDFTSAGGRRYSRRRYQNIEVCAARGGNHVGAVFSISEIPQNSDVAVAFADERIRTFAKRRQHGAMLRQLFVEQQIASPVRDEPPWKLAANCFRGAQTGITGQLNFQ